MYCLLYRHELLDLHFKTKSSRGLSFDVVIDIENTEEVIYIREYLDNPIRKSLVRIGNEKNGVGNKESLVEEFNLYKNPGIILFFLLKDKCIGDDGRCLYRRMA